MIEEVRKCTICKIEKLISEFYTNYKHCKLCNQKTRKKWLSRPEIHDRIKKYNCTWMKKYRQNNLQKLQIRQKQYINKLRLEVFTHYSNGIPICECCGELDIRFLTIDHRDNNGAEHRREILKEKYNGQLPISGDMAGIRFYTWLRKNKYPDLNLGVLCYNCNCGRQHNKGICPHKDKEND